MAPKIVYKNSISGVISKLKNDIQLSVKLMLCFSQQEVDEFCETYKFPRFTYQDYLFDLLAYAFVQLSLSYRLPKLLLSENDSHKVNRLLYLYGNKPEIYRVYYKNPITRKVFNYSVGIVKQKYVDYYDPIGTYDYQYTSYEYDSKRKSDPNVVKDQKFRKDVLEIRKKLYGDEPNLDKVGLFSVKGSLFQPLDQHDPMNLIYFQ